MSWMKPGQGGASPGPPAYPAPKHHQAFGNQQNVYSNYGAPAPGPGAAPQQQFWQIPAQQQHQQQQYSQQYGQVYQQDFQANANQFYQPPAGQTTQQPPVYNQNYSQGYQGNVQQNAHQNYYANQQHGSFQQNPTQPSDGWEDNWDWGWDESAKQAQVAHNATQALQPPAPAPAPALAPVAHQERAFNNANVIEESFGTNDSWNWAIDDKKDNKEPSLPPPQPDNIQAEPAAPPVAHTTSKASGVSEVNPPPVSVNNGPQQHVEEVRTLNDRDVIKERLPNLAAGRRLHLDNLTPQWSIESQMSQESSDGPQTHSEGTYRSENQSRNSSSPGPNTDNSNFNYSQPAFDDNSYTNNEWSRHSDEHTLADRDAGDRESHDELTNSLQDMSLTNYENVSTSNSHPPETNGSRNTPENISEIQPSPVPSPSLPAAPAQAATAPTAPVRPSSASLQPPPTSGAAPPPPTSGAAPPPAAPPPIFPPPSSGSHNPFKNAGPFSHKSTSRSSIGGGGSSYLSSPGVVAQAQQARTPVGFEANLETTPDNSERPDQPPAAPYRPQPVHPAPLPVPDNMEVAPRHDRNEYMQTAHLSGGAAEGEEYGSNAEEPPPGLRPPVVGRREEEPPPPGPRLVPGAAERRVYRQAEGQQYRSPPDVYRVVPGLDYPPPRDDRGDGQAAPGPEPPPPPPEDAPRDLTMEGENLQDPPGPVDPQPAQPAGPAPAAPASLGSRRGSLPRRDSTPDDSDRDPRRDRERDRGRSSRDKEGRYSRGDRDERRSTRDKDRRERDRRDRERDRDREGSPDARRRRDRRSARHRYETEDTDYYSDRERDRRSYREGSYGKPPRGDGDRSRRHEARRHGATAERDRERPRRHEDRERYREEPRGYRDIDPNRKYGNLRRERDEDDRRRVVDQSPSREATATDEELPVDVRRERRRDRRRDRDRDRDREREREREPYYDNVTQRQYEYYAQLRATDPAAYMQLYKQLMATHYHGAGYGTLGAHGALGALGAPYDAASVHSGRSSTNGLKGNDTYYMGDLRPPPSIRTDISDRDLNTDASLNLQLEESTVRSERMTPFKYSTAHVKGSMSSRDLVVVVAAYPVDGAGGAVRVCRAGEGAGGPGAALRVAPGPPRHKKSATEYCAARAAAARAGTEGAPEPAGYALLWDVLALMVRQNGSVEGADVADVLMKNVRDFPWKQQQHTTHSRNESRRESSVSGSADDSPAVDVPRHDTTTRAEKTSDEAAALEKYQEYLIYGNKQEALDWAMSAGLWGHALALAAYGAPRERAVVLARFLASLPPSSPLHTAYAALGGAAPPAVSAAADPRAPDWRPHAAVLMANPTRRPDFDNKTLIQLGDALAARGLAYSAQCVWMCAGGGWRAHPLAPHPPRPDPAASSAHAPPRLSLLLADPRAETFAALATPQAILATEMYEYGRSLGTSGGYALPELQVYRLWAALALADGGHHARALAYVEAAARAVALAPSLYPPMFVRALATLGDRLQYHDAVPHLHDEEGADDAAPHHWLHHIQGLAQHTQATQATEATGGVSLQSTPHHQPQYTPHHQHYEWGDQSQQQQYQQQPQVQPLQQQPEVNQTYADPEPAPANVGPPPDYSAYYGGAAPDAPAYPGDQWGATPEDPAAPAPAPYTDYSWQHDQYSYSEGQTGGEESRPTITMPGGMYRDDDTNDTHNNADESSTDRTGGDSASSKPDSKNKEEKGGSREGGKGKGWLGGILNKLSLRPPNQMILPDDKNPTIVWDKVNKRWVNTEGEEEGGGGAGGALPPPPSNAQLHRQTASPPLQSTPGAPPPAPPVSNIFKMQKGRHIKKSYVDVFNPSGAATRPLPPAAEVLGPPAPPADHYTAHNYFVPTAQHTQPMKALLECVEVEVPITPSPSPDAIPEQSGVYEPTSDNDDQYRSGI